MGCPIYQGLVPDEKQLNALDAIELVTFIGYPNGLWDQKNFAPLARRGYTASPITIDYEGNPHFLIDASVFGGSSGSPVFLLNQGSYTDKFGNVCFGSRCLFLGDIKGSYKLKHFNPNIPIPRSNNRDDAAPSSESIDLGVVVKARAVLETIEAALKTHRVL